MKKILMLITAIMMVVSANAVTTLSSSFGSWGDGCTVDGNTITYSTAWKGAGYWLSDLDLSDCDYVWVTMEEGGTAALKMVVQYTSSCAAGASGTSEASCEAGALILGAQLDPAQKNDVAQFYLQATTTGSITVTGCYAGTEEEYEAAKAGNVQQRSDLNLTNLSAGWSSSYDSETKTITYEGDWCGRGWWLGSADYSGFDYVVIKFAEPTSGYCQVIIQYADAEDSSTPVEAGSTEVVIPLDETGKSSVKQIYIQNGSGVTSIVLAEAYVCTAEYQNGPSVATFVSVSPEAGSTVDMDTEYVVTFSQPVKYTSYLSDITVGQNPFGNGDGATFWMNDEKTEIHAKLDASTLAMYGITTTEELVAKMGSSVALHVYKVKDEATGEALEYNDPDDEDQFTFTYKMGEATLAVEPADGSTVEKIDVVYFACAEGISIADASQNILVNKDKQTVATVAASDLTDDADSHAFLMTFAEPFTEAGTYEIYIPEGTFTLGGANTNKTTIVTYTIAGETSTGIHVTPAAGEVTSLKDFVLTYGDGTEMISPSYSYNMTITDAEGGVLASISSDDIEVAEYSGEGWDAVPSKLTFSVEEIMIPGTYTLNIPAGMFYVGPYFDNCEETSFTWTIAGGSSSSVDVTADPADGSNVESLSKITLTFNGAEMVDYSYELSSSVTVINDATGESATSMVQFGYGNDMNQITVEMTPVTEAGKYTVTIPAGAIKVGFDFTPTTEDIVLHYTIGSDTPAGPTINFTADPADGSTVSSLGKITLTFSSAVSADYDPAMSTSATVTNDATGESATSLTYLGWGEGLNQITLEMVPVKTEGNYTVTIPAGAILLDNAATTEDIVLHYTVSVADGINSINASDNETKFNVAGQRVNNNAKGIIIKNGKKYLNK